MKFPEIKIDKDIPPPPERYSAAGGYYGPVNKLEINESFEFPRFLQSSYASAACVLRRRTGKTFTVRKTGPEACRIWRLS